MIVGNGFGSDDGSSTTHTLIMSVSLREQHIVWRYAALKTVVDLECEAIILPLFLRRENIGPFYLKNPDSNLAVP